MESGAEEGLSSWKSRPRGGRMLFMNSAVLCCVRCLPSENQGKNF